MNKIKRLHIEAFLKFCQQKDIHLLYNDYSESDCSCAYYTGVEWEDIIDEYFDRLEGL